MNREQRQPKLRWFQLTLRDMLLVTVICGILLAWWSDRQHLQQDVMNLRAELASQLAKSSELLAQVRLLRTVMADRGLPFVDGRVSRTLPNGVSVEINLGRNDGLKQGDRLDVWRASAGLLICFSQSETNQPQWFVTGWSTSKARVG